MNQGQGNSGSGTAVAPAKTLTTEALALLVQTGATPDRVCEEIAGLFRVRLTEIALLRLENRVLRFLYPEELKAMGMIPLSSPSIAAHTALSGEPELFNNFAQIKHATVFETVKLGAGPAEKPVHLPIQKMLSAPIFSDDKQVLGVLQISRKGLELASAGADFTGEDLKQLQITCKVLSQSTFLQKEK